MYSLIATGREHGVDSRIHFRDVLLRIGKTNDTRDLTPYGWNAKWLTVVQAQRASIVERLASKLAR